MTEFRRPKSKPENVRKEKSTRRSRRVNGNKNRNAPYEDERAILELATAKLNEVYEH